MLTPVQIHEFSTGIHPQKTADGGWVSLGFTGQYMNATIPIPISHPVARSIANKEFAVAEGASTDEPAIIGRVISRNGEDWSVIAFVTRGRDEKGRSASFYRYFLCEGANNLWEIIYWIEYYKKRHQGKLPVFNPFEDPFEDKDVGEPNYNQYKSSRTEPSQIDLPDKIVDSPAPVLLSPNSVSGFQLLNRFAIEKANLNQQPNQQPIAWAYNVEALEQPNSFLVIQAASEKASQLLKRSIATNSQIMTAASIDEQAIKSAIKGLINVSVPKAEHIQTIVESLENPDITDSFWRSIFDGPGATKAIKQGIYSPQMVRLLALRAIVVPDTLPEYLNWLGKPNKQNSNLAVAEEFQSQFKTKVKTDNLNDHLGKGIKDLIILAYDKPEFVESIVWLLNTEIWSNIYQREVVRDIDHDLKLMPGFAGGSKTEPFKLAHNKQWDKLFKEIKDCWKIRPRPRPKDKYQPLADIFGELRSYKIAAVFYQLGYGKVPKEIFSRINNKSWETNIYGLKVEREVTIPELVILSIVKVAGYRVPVAIVFLLLILSFAIGFTVKGFLPSNNYQVKKQSNIEVPTATSPEAPEQQIPSQNPSPQNPNPGKTVAIEIPQEKRQTALDKFLDTMKAIDSIITKTKAGIQKNPPTDSEILTAIQTVLTQKREFKFQPQELTYQDLNKRNLLPNEVKYKWIEAIYNYQVDKKAENQVGYLVQDGQINSQLIKDVKNELKQSSTLPSGR